MSPRQALNLLDEVASRFDGKRQDHFNLQSAINVLNALVIKDETETQDVADKVEDAAKKVVGKKEQPKE